MLTVVRPSPLRLWGFLLTVLGGALLAFGAISDWAVVTLGGSSQSAVPTKGIDLWQGSVALALGVLIIAGVLALRFVRPRRRTAVAVVLIALGIVALALALWCVVAIDRLVPGEQTLVDTVAAQLAIPQAEARELVQRATAAAGIDVEVQAGLWITLAGALVATAGGLVDLAWVRRKRAAGDAIDVDTAAAETDGPN